MIPKSKVFTLGAIMVGGLLGLIFPMCECGIIPVMRRLLRKGVPLSVCVCYLLAGPIINVVVIGSTYMAFSGPGYDPYGGGWGIAGMRVGLGFVVAFVTALVVDWQHRKHGNALLTPLAAHDVSHGADDVVGPPRTWRSSLANISETALHDFIDILAFLVLGAFLATLGRLALP